MCSAIISRSRVCCITNSENEISGFFCVPGGIDGVILKKTEVKIEGSCKISVS